jgi:hypothetical protein
MSKSDLVGTWQLLSYFDVDEAGNTGSAPLGLAPKGLLIYGDNDYVSVSMMRTDQDILTRSHSGEDVSSDLTSPPEIVFMGYTGKWRLDGQRVIHEVKVSSDPSMVDEELIREWSIDGDRLTIYGTIPIGDRIQRRALNWQRV